MNTPFNIGTLRVETRALSAPMAGLSLPAFRKLLMELGCGLAFTEMVSAEGVVYANERTKQYYENAEEIHPHAVQFFTSKPAMLEEAIRRIDCDAIDLYDLNMGCPVKKVVKKGAGSALMKTPKLAAQLIESVKRTTAKPATVKIRAGWDETSINCVEFARAMEGAGADAITVHPRTRAQEFRGSANWELIGKVKSAVKIPVIGNGDIKTAEDAKRMLAETSCDAVMIGRAAYRNPWIFAELADKVPLLCKEGSGEVESISTPSNSPLQRGSAKRKMVLRYMDLLQETRDERHVIYAMRSFLSRFAKGHTGTSKFMAKVHQISNVLELKQTIEAFSFIPVL